MAKGKRSNSPKRSRRGGRKSPKKNKVQKAISKGEFEQKHHDAEVEEPDCVYEAEELPKIDDEVKILDVTTVKENLVEFFWNSLTEDAHASTKLLSQLDESVFFFGKVAAELAKCDKFTDEVENDLALVWKADEAWIRSFLAGEVELPKPEEPEQPEEPEAAIEEQVQPEVEMEAEVEAEVTTEIQAETVGIEGNTEIEAETVVETAEIAPEEKVEVDDIAMADVVEEKSINADESFEIAVDQENAAVNVMAEAAVKAVASKLGEQSFEGAAPVAGSPLMDLNVVQEGFA